jgi:hypothetical protein
MNTSQVSRMAALIEAGDIIAENFISSKFLPVARYLRVKANLSFTCKLLRITVSFLLKNGSLICRNLLNVSSFMRK